MAEEVLNRNVRAGGEARVQLLQLLRGEGGVVDWAEEEKEEEGDDATSCLRP